MNIQESLLQSLEKSARDAQMISTFREFLLREAKQVGTLYHFTTLSRIENILNSQKLKKGSQGYISLTRDFQLPMDSDYFDKDEYIVRISLDGDKISENIKIIPHSDKNYGDEREEGILNDINIKYFKQIDILSNTSRYFSRTSIDAVFESVKKKFSNTNLVTKWRVVR